MYPKKNDAAPRPAPERKPRKEPLNCYKFTLEYDGTRYQGWQEQINARTVAGSLKEALVEVFGPDVELGGAGRTDAGVHALGQVAHVKTAHKLHPAEAMRGVNARLPADINVLRVDSAEPNFNARRHAIARYYLYQISLQRTAFAKRYVWWVRDPVDLAAMRAGAEMFRGFHDFTAFSHVEPGQRPGPDEIPDGAEGPRRVDLHDISIMPRPGMLVIRVGASHFLWKMVRRIVGSLVAVGHGNMTPEDIRELLRSKRPSEAVAQLTAPASGLFLERVEYPRVISEPTEDTMPKMGVPKERSEIVGKLHSRPARDPRRRG